VCGKIYINGHIIGCGCGINRGVLSAFCSSTCLEASNFELSPNCIGDLYENLDGFTEENFAEFVDYSQYNM